MPDYVAPDFPLNGFNCPHCHAYTQQSWFRVRHSPIDNPNLDQGIIGNYFMAICQKPDCHQISFWEVHDESRIMFYPNATTAPLPSDDMPEIIRGVFNEARNVFGISPRAAAGLLRLAIQMLMPHLNQKGKDLNEDIGNLVKSGLPEMVQKGLDSLRVIGNNAVHPGQIDISDNRDVAIALFHIINTIINRTLTEERIVQETFDLLPESAKEQIRRRDQAGSV